MVVISLFPRCLYAPLFTHRKRDTRRGANFFSVMTVLLYSLLLSFPAFAQQAYETGNLPQIQIDRSVLDTVESNSEDNPPAPLPHPSVSSTPSVEDMLGAQVENTRVITQLNPPSQLSAPSPVMTETPATIVHSITPPPAPTLTPAKPKRVFARPIIDEPKAKPIPKTTKKETSPKAETKKVETKKVEEKKPDDKKIIAKVAEEKTILAPTPKLEQKPLPKPKNDFISAKYGEPEALKEKIKPVNAYRPKAAKSMPAVPSSKVERDILPPMNAPMNTMGLPSLPPTTNAKTTYSKPSIGERMMDAALASKIENDPEVIRETIQNKKIKTVTSKYSKATPPPVTVPSSLPSERDAETGFAPAPAMKAFISPPRNSILFAPEQITMTLPLQFKIDDDILPDIKKSATARIQLMSFATSPDGTEAAARRISLSRALAVREYLLVKEVDAGRIDVRALANQGGSTHPDRVDVVLLP